MSMSSAQLCGSITTVKFNESFLLLCQDLSLRPKKHSVIKTTPLSLVQFYKFFCTKLELLLRLLYRKENMLRTFYRCLLEGL